MATSTLKIPANDVRVVSLAKQDFKPTFEYEDGVKTDRPRTNEDGLAIYALREQAATLFGQSAIVNLQSLKEQTINAGAIIVPKPSGILTVRADASRSGFSSLALTVFAEEWQEIANIMVSEDK